MRTKRYYQIRTVVRFLVWAPICTAAYVSLVIGWANLL